MTTPSGDADPGPLARVVEIGVFAPIGLASLACEHVPGLAARGRARVEQRVVLARFVGQLAVGQIRKEVDRRLTSTPSPAPPAPAPSAPAPPTPEPTTTAPTTTGPATPGDPVPSAAVRPAAAAPAAHELAIADYAHLPASDVIALLADLDPAELKSIRAFEVAHRNRRTVLGRIAQLSPSA